MRLELMFNKILFNRKATGVRIYYFYFDFEIDCLVNRDHEPERVFKLDNEGKLVNKRMGVYGESDVFIIRRNAIQNINRRSGDRSRLNKPENQFEIMFIKMVKMVLTSTN